MNTKVLKLSQLNRHDERVPDDTICQRARLSRDARFDGVFFVGVISTGIYCRPICPAPLPKEENVRYFASAQEASVCGLRPCLRCRPESAPGSAPWRGVATTLSRAMALIDAGALNAETIEAFEHDAAPKVEALAARLGVGSRYLRKLFQQQLGMSPKAYGDYRRLLLAKSLLHQTTMPVTEVAFAAGFGSLRRFNEVFQEKLGLTPASLRRPLRTMPSQMHAVSDKTDCQSKRALTNERAKPDAESSVQLMLSFRPPYDFMAIREFFMARAIEGNEWFVDAQGLPCCGKTLTLGQVHGWFEASPIEGKHALSVRIYPGPVLGNLSLFLAQCRRILDLDTNLGVIEAHLAKAITAVKQQDATIHPISADAQHAENKDSNSQNAETLGRNMAIRSLPGAGSHFEACCRAVLGQQVSLRQATALLNALVAEVGEAAQLGLRQCQLFPSPAAVASANLQSLKMPGARKLALNRLGELFDTTPEPTDAQILALKGVGPWTVNYAKMRGLSSPDVLLDGDLIVRQRLALFGLSDDLPALKARVSPWGSYLTLMLWHTNLESNSARVAEDKNKEKDEDDGSIAE